MCCLIGRWFVHSRTRLHLYPLGGYRTDVFTGSAPGTELLVDTDSDSWNKLDRPGLAPFHAGEATAVSGEACVIMGNRRQLFMGRGDEVCRVRYRHGGLRRTRQNTACGTERFPEREQAFSEEIFAADVHCFFVPSFADLVSLITPCPWHPVQDKRSGCGVTGASSTPVLWQPRQYSPSDVSLKL